MNVLLIGAAWVCGSLLFTAAFCVGACMGQARANRDRINVARRREIAMLETMRQDAS